MFCLPNTCPILHGVQSQPRSRESQCCSEPEALPGATTSRLTSRIDPLGFALEQYDAIGRWRNVYQNGETIEITEKLTDGTVIKGAEGLRVYLKNQEPLFHRTFCTKLVGYALGRRESISDVMLIDQIMTDIENGGRFSAVVERVVASRQFRYRRAGSEGPLEARERNE